MKKLNFIMSLLAMGALIGIQACSEEPGIGGNAHIQVTVVEHHADAGGDHHEGLANTKVHIWYGQADATGDPDDQTTSDIYGGVEFGNVN